MARISIDGSDDGSDDYSGGYKSDGSGYTYGQNFSPSFAPIAAPSTPLAGAVSNSAPPRTTGTADPPTYPAPPVIGNSGVDTKSVWLTGGANNPNYVGPGGSYSSVGGLSSLNPATIKSQFATPNAFFDRYAQGLLTQGVSPQQLADFTNSAYSLPSGQSIAYDPSRGSQGILEMPASANNGQGGYYSFDNNQWAFHPTSPEGAAGSSYGGTNIFSDPATQQYEQLINQMVGNLNTPYTPPDFQPAVDYLKSYFQQLQNPVYTPQQRDLIQTQTLDPLTQQRDATRQQIIQHFAQQGVPPSSGIVQKALLDSDQSFEQLRTQAQGQFSTNEINMGRQQQQQAASLGPMIASIEQAQQQGNEGRALQGLNVASIIPQLAWSRLTGANNTIQQTNPFQALQLLNQFQTQGYNQGANYGSGLANVIGSLLQAYANG